MIRFFSFIFLVLIFQLKISLAQTSDYAVSNIPDSLKENVNAVFRLDKGIFQIYSVEKSIFYGKQVITILNKNAERHAHFKQFYDMYSKINYVNGKVYDKNGIIIKKFKKKDVNDESITSFSLYDDNRVKFIKYYSNNYPFTVEYEYEIQYDGFLYYPPWYFLPGYDISVERSEYKVIVPKGFEFRYIQNNFNNNVQISESDLNTEYLWEMDNIMHFEDEPFSPRSNTFFPNIQFGPKDFYYGGYYGNCETWESFGKWQLQLLENRQELSEVTIKTIREITGNISDTLGKIKAVYEFLQSKTRYVSIQLGIGGLQPFPASEVDRVGYGDCKALSNYMMALLKSIGIKSDYTKIYSGKIAPIVNDSFPLNFSNHVILMIPINYDTIWLECTSQKLPFGYIHSNIGNRTALVITQNGGRLLNVPGLKDKENLQKRIANVTIYENGSGNAKITTEYSGYQFENIFGLKDIDPDRQKKWLYKNIDIPSFTINSFNFEEIKMRYPIAIEKLDLQLNNYASISGKRIFLPANLMNKNNYVPRELKERKTPIVLKYGYFDVDSIFYQIPDIYKIENIPDAIEIVSDFGIYRSEVIEKDNQLFYIRKILFRKGTFPPDKYDELREFYLQIERADRSKIVLIRKS